MPELQTYRGVYIWKYVPSLPAAIVFAILFAVATAGHGWKMSRTRMWFCVPFVIGGACRVPLSTFCPPCYPGVSTNMRRYIVEVIGYIGRAAAYNDTGTLGPFMVQGVFLVLPPIFFAASLYMVYSRLVRSVDGASLSLMSPRWTTRIFVSGDWICLNIQGAGAGLLFKPATMQTGNWIVTAGLAIQLMLFIGFIGCCATFHRRFRAHLARTGATTDIPWQTCFYMLYGTSLAVMVRNIYRVIEFVSGQDSYLFVNEWTIYVFDAALMLLVMVVFYIWYPSQLRTPAKESRRDAIQLESTTDGRSSGP